VLGNPLYGGAKEKSELTNLKLEDLEDVESLLFQAPKYYYGPWNPLNFPDKSCLSLSIS
jgi:hypothetical protein